MIELMKAHTLKDESLLDSDLWVAEEKLDGHRLEIEVNSGLHAWSKLGNDVINDHPWLKEVKWPQRTVLDCELYVPGGSSNQTNEDVTIEQLAVLDMLKFDGCDLMAEQYMFRRQVLLDVVQWLSNTRVVAVRMQPDLKRLFYDLIVAAGGEGIMLKDMRGQYVQCPGTRRSWLWQKKKKWLTVEVVIVGCDGKPTMWTVKPGHVGADGVLYPNGKPSDTAAKGYVNLEYGYWAPNGLVKVGTLGITGPREELKQYVGRVAEVKCAAVYDSGALRHPTDVVWRDDKKAEDCTLLSIIQAAGKHVIKTKGK
jgi:hypothetical protein